MVTPLPKPTVDMVINTYTVTQHLQIAAGGMLLADAYKNAGKHGQYVETLKSARWHADQARFMLVCIDRGHHEEYLKGGKTYCRQCGAGT